MVKRYPHTAIITIEAEGLIVHGEEQQGATSEIVVKGCYFASDRGQHNMIRKNTNGDEIVVRGEFSTKHKPVDSITRIKIDSIGLDAPVICWDKFQTHSVIYI